MNRIVPNGYAVPIKERNRLERELRQERAAESANASEKERARIEKEIAKELKRKLAAAYPKSRSIFGAFILR